MRSIKKRIEKIEKMTNPIGVFFCIQERTKSICLESSGNTCYENIKGNIEYFKNGKQIQIDDSSQEITSIIIDNITHLH